MLIKLRQKYLKGKQYKSIRRSGGKQSGGGGRKKRCRDRAPR